MSVVSLNTASEKLGGFYVPRFEIRVEGFELPEDVVRDVIDVSYRDSVDAIDSVELTVNNWDPATNSFKYVGAETTEDLESSASEARLFRLFEPCSREFEVLMGYQPEMWTMMSGIFTTMEPSFPSGGAPTLKVRGLNVLHQLRGKQYTTAWEGMRDSEVAKEIATLRDEGEKRFPLAVEINDAALAAEEPIVYLAQENQYDIDFLLTRASVRGYVVYVNEGSHRNPDRHLYFGPSDEGPEEDIYQLEWGESLIDFTPTLTTANQVRSVTVKGWDRDAKQAISETVSLDDRDLSKNKDLHELLSRCDPREERVVNRPVFTVAEARRLATDLLINRQRDMVKASGTTVGLPGLRAGRTVMISGLGARFSGRYFVTESTHTIGDGGYTTRFQVRREDEQE